MLRKQFFVRFDDSFSNNNYNSGCAARYNVGASVTLGVIRDTLETLPTEEVGD